MGVKGAFALLFFFICPFLKTLLRLKLSLLAFTYYLLWGLKNLPPLNFKLSPPLTVTVKKAQQNCFQLFILFD